MTPKRNARTPVLVWKRTKPALAEESRHYKQYELWLTAARQHGFSSMNEAIVMLYRQHHSSARVGRLLGGMTGANVRYHMKRLGEPLRSRGGANNQTGRPGRSCYDVNGMPLRTYCRAHGLNYPRIWNRIKNLGWTIDEALSIPNQRTNYGTEHALS